MSQFPSTRAPERDWAKLLETVTESDFPLTQQQLSLWEQGLLDGETDVTGRDYVTAMQAALEQREAGTLLKMLDAGLPVPRILLPVLADVIRSAHHGTAGGRASKLTAIDDGNIRFLFDVMTEHHRGKPANVRRWLLKSFREKLRDPNLSIATLNRALRRTGQPSPARFVMLPALPRSSKSPERRISGVGDEAVAVRSVRDSADQALLDYDPKKSGS